MAFLRTSGLSILVVAWFGSALAGEAPRVVVELFTSQGCSSCPPADRLLGELAAAPDVVALTLPVDYWDYLGWKDTLAERLFTTRQKGYGDVRGDRHVYTPQAVLNGSAHAVGSDADAIRQVADRVAPAKGLVPLALDVKGGRITVRVPAADAPETGATVFLLPVLRHSEVDIGRGENGGRRATYVNVVRDIVPLGTWSGGAGSFEAPASVAGVRGADTYVALLQSGTREHPGPILGVAKGPGL